MINIIALPAFSDNYIWLFHHTNCKSAYVVDPGDDAVVEAGLQQYGLELSGILITHHHWDHTGGIESLCQDRGIPVYGPDSAKIPQITHIVEEGTKLVLASDDTKDFIEFDVLAVPGHTLDHIAYFAEASEHLDSPVLFSGDTLFAGGCGRMFEGTPTQMQDSLQKLTQLPASTRVYCAHEYTQSNLSFALAVEPDNSRLQARSDQVAELRRSDKATVPSLLEEELRTNPFLRWQSQAVQSAVSQRAGQALTKPADIFGSLRQWKDNF